LQENRCWFHARRLVLFNRDSVADLGPATLDSPRSPPSARADPAMGLAFERPSASVAGSASRSSRPVSFTLLRIGNAARRHAMIRAGRRRHRGRWRAAVGIAGVAAVSPFVFSLWAVLAVLGGTLGRAELNAYTGPRHRTCCARAHSRSSLGGEGSLLGGSFGEGE